MGKNHVLLYSPPKVFLVEGSQSCSQCFSKPESACTKDVQFVASQFDLSQTREFPVSGSGLCVRDKLCFLLRSASPGMILEEQSMGGFCFWWPKSCVCVCPWTAQGSLLKLQFILCPQVVILTLLFYNLC